jgi:hypothetical protein
VAGSVARWLLRWATTRHDVSRPSWIHALSAEFDEIGTGRSQLAWAVGSLRVLWAERRMSRRSRLWVRLRWMGSAGGLGGLRVYTPAVVGGILMATWSYWHRDDDAPIPLIAAVLLAPYYALIGLWWGRRRTVGTAALVGAVNGAGRLWDRHASYRDRDRRHRDGREGGSLAGLRSGVRDHGRLGGSLLRLGRRHTCASQLDPPLATPLTG